MITEYETAIISVLSIKHNLKVSFYLRSRYLKILLEKLNYAKIHVLLN